jgi:hypothetical protein
MSHLILLPTPLPSNSITLGQLISNPTDPYATVSSLPQQSNPAEIGFRDGYKILSNSESSFDRLRNNISTHTSFRNAAQSNQPLYFVTGIQTSPTKSPESEESSTDAVRVRRVDSASSLLPKNTKSDTAISALQLLQVKCLISTPSEPHSVEDLGYEWSYHVLGEEVQLCVGLERGQAPVASRKAGQVMWDSGAETYDDDGEIGGF